MKTRLITSPINVTGTGIFPVCGPSEDRVCLILSSSYILIQYGQVQGGTFSGWSVGTGFPPVVMHYRDWGEIVKAGWSCNSGANPVGLYCYEVLERVVADDGEPLLAPAATQEQPQEGQANRREEEERDRVAELARRRRRSYRKG